MQEVHCKLDPCRCRNQKITEQIVIGTHGKLKNWLGKRTLDVSAVKILVFDEADQMLEVSTSFAVDASNVMQNHISCAQPQACINLVLAL